MAALWPNLGLALRCRYKVADYVPRAHDELDSCERIVSMMTAMFLSAWETHGQDARATKSACLQK